MKIIKYNLLIFLFILGSCTLYGQYNGGSSDGFSSETINEVSCAFPSSFISYFGGSGDGAAVDNLENTTCGFSNNFYAYFGGSNDGATVETIENTACDFPPQFYAYFGGINDGSALSMTAPICPTDPPVADFTASATAICVGQSVTFTDASTNIPGAWTWTLPGGTPNSSIVQNPTVVYDTAGTYAVTLKAFNYNGNNTKTVTGYIIVSDYPIITSTTPASRCDSGKVTLKATTSVGTLSWYANPTGGTALGTGANFITPTLSLTTTYYVESVNASCSSPRTAVIATVNTTPTITSSTPEARCGSGQLTLTATSSAGNTLWYEEATGGTALATSNSFLTPVLNTTTTYYVEASTGSCTSARTAVTATVNTLPTITGTTPDSRCDTGTLTLKATASSGTLNWYANTTGGSSLGAGTNFTTPSLSTSTTYYVDATNGICVSARTPVTASIQAVSAPTGTANQTFCGSEKVSSLAITGTGIVWYDQSTAGNVVPNSTTLVSGMTYYASQNNGTCESPTRFAVTVNTGGCLGTENFVFKEIKIYPNPVTSILNISNSELISKVEVTDMLGRTLSTKLLNDLETKIDMSNLPTGTYLVQVTIDNASKTFKVIKK